MEIDAKAGGEKEGVKMSEEFRYESSELRLGEGWRYLAQKKGGC